MNEFLPADSDVNQEVRSALYKIEHSPQKVLDLFVENPEYCKYTHYEWFNKTEERKIWCNPILHEILVYSLNKNNLDIINGYLDLLIANNIEINEFDYINGVSNKKFHAPGHESPVLFAAKRIADYSFDFDKSNRVMVVIEKLIDCGFDANVYDDKNRNIFMILLDKVPNHSLTNKILASGVNFPDTEKSNLKNFMINIAAYTLENVQDINSIRDIIAACIKEHPNSTYENSFLDCLQYVDRPEIFEALISSGFNPAMKSVDGFTIFDKTKSQRADYIEILLNIKPDIANYTYKDKSTPLTRSLIAKNDSLSALLIARGASLDNGKIMGGSIGEFIENSDLAKTKSTIRAMEARKEASDVIHEIRNEIKP